MNAFRGWVHVLWDDSGAGRIAGIDLNQNGAVIVSMLAFTRAQQTLHTWLLWVWKPLPVEAPGKYGALIALPFMALAFWLSVHARPLDAPRA